MEKLLAWSDSKEPWTLEHEKELLNALQTLSSDIMANVQKLDTALIEVEKKTASLTTRYNNAAFDFKMLGESQFIEQTVKAMDARPREASTADRPSTTADEAQEELFSKYKEAIQIASSAGDDSEVPATIPALPFIFGSPEYLQSGGLGLGGPEPEPGVQEPSVEPTDISQAEALPLASDSGGNNGEDSDGSSDEAPDFRSSIGRMKRRVIQEVKCLPCRAMLEAALKGDLDNLQLEDLEGESPASHNDVSNQSWSDEEAEASLPEFQHPKSQNVNFDSNLETLLHGGEQSSSDEAEKILKNLSAYSGSSDNLADLDVDQMLANASVSSKEST